VRERLQLWCPKNSRRERIEVVTFLLSVFPIGEVITVVGVVDAVSIASIIGASRSYDRPSHMNGYSASPPPVIVGSPWHQCLWFVR